MTRGKVVAARMKSKSVRKLAVLGLALATLFLNGCGQSESERLEARREAITQGLDRANRLLFSGQTDQALDQLEALDQQYPNSPEVLEAMAFAYAKKPDHALAAFYFDTVVQLDPSRADLAMYAARSHGETGDTASAARAYQIYLQDSPEDAAAWRALAQALTSEHKSKAALDAWLQAIKLSGGKPDAADAASIGRLYLDLDNLPQARRLFEASLTAPAEGDSRARALLGLLEVDIREKQWAAAEKRIAQLDKVDPAALDNSPLAAARLELKSWREAQAELAKQQLVAATEKKKAEEAAALAQAEAVRKEGTSGTITIDRTGETINLAGGSNTALPPDLDKSATLPGPPAHREEERVTATVAETGATTPTNTGEEVAPTPLANGSTGTTATTTTVTETVVEVAAPPPVSPQSLRERADLAYEAGNFAEAIRLYQAALAEEPDAAPVYYGLSRAYYESKQWPQAELYASEAKRLNPGDLRYTVNFLRAIQRTQSSERLMAEMIRAKERFPDSPDITLALARGYERLYNNRRNAIFLYQEFLTLAPAHPQAEDIRRHLQTIR